MTIHCILDYRSLNNVQSIHNLGHIHEKVHKWEDVAYSPSKLAWIYLLSIVNDTNFQWVDFQCGRETRSGVKFFYCKGEMIDNEFYFNQICD